VPDDVVIRPATLDDLDALLALYTELADERPGAAPADPVAGRTLLAEILTYPRRELLVAVDGTGARLGSVDGLIVTNLTRGGRPWAVVENVIVTASARRRGIGALLIEELVVRATAANCYKLQLLSNKRRTHAHAFYESVGFTAVAEGFRRYLD
jgi:ribosomal protein S18 acetylase RimI-like enzyme